MTGADRLPTAAAIGLALSALAGAAQAARAAPSICTPGETAVFDCHIGARVAALCATPDLSPTAGRLRYVFGRPGKVEISLPPDSDTGRTAFTEGVLGFSGGGADYVRIANGRTAYVVYSAMGSDGLDKHSMKIGVWNQNGVAVEKDGKQAASLFCSNDPMGKDVWGPVYAAKLPQDGVGFIMPDAPVKKRR